MARWSKVCVAGAVLVAMLAICVHLQPGAAQGFPGGGEAFNTSYAAQLFRGANLMVHNSTIFAPTNEAFDDLGLNLHNITDLLNSTYIANSTQILKLHIVPGIYTNATVPIGNTTLNTLAGMKIILEKKASGMPGEPPMVTVYVPGTDTEAGIAMLGLPFMDNVVHLSDTVFLPFNMTLS